MMTLEDGFNPRRVLAIGAHADDIEIGAGGILLALSERNPELTVDWVVLSAKSERRREARESAQLFFNDEKRLRVRLEEYRQRYFPYNAELKEYFDALGGELSPDLILCPSSKDAHQDHRTVADLVLNTFRDHVILQYEIPKTDGDIGRPSLYVDLTRSQAERKVELLMKGFPSQHHRKWFDEEVFFGLMRLRGMESLAESGYAEAFYSSKLKLIGG
jgi:LmbE family N-acetylglucosaminyl deacetylase